MPHAAQLESIAPTEEQIRHYAPSPWNDTNTAYLKEKWLVGQSARDIAAHIGVTRSAVIGRAHRLCLKRDVDFTFWSPEESAQLRLLWDQGLSASQIAQQISRKWEHRRICKSTILNKARRMGLPGRRRSVESYRGNTKRIRKPVPFATIIDTNIPIEQRRTLVQLEPRECKWPIGDPESPEFFFCGGAAHERGPYCSAHHHRAFGYAPSGKKFSGFRF